jgi:hypothetical protein
MKTSSVVIGIVVLVILAAILAAMLIISAGFVRRFAMQLRGIADLSLFSRRRLDPDFGVRFDQYLKACAFGKLAKLMFERPREALWFVLPVVFFGGMAVMAVWAIAVAMVARMFASQR